MIEQMGQDVENAVDPSTTEPAEQEQNVSQEGALDSSADSENTDETKHVPYDRFKQVNDKFRQTEKELNEYREKMKLWDDVSKVASQDPRFNTAFNELVERYNRGELTAAEEKKVEQMQEDVASVNDPRVDTLLRKYEKDTFNRYDADFTALASKDFEDKEDIAMVGKMLTDIINEKHPNALEEYNPQLVSKYYTEAKQKIDNLVKRKMGKYMDSKASDDIPTNDPSSAPAYDFDVSTATREQRSAHLAERLKQFKE